VWQAPLARRAIAVELAARGCETVAVVEKLGPRQAVALAAVCRVPVGEDAHLPANRWARLA